MLILHDGPDKPSPPIPIRTTAQEYPNRIPHSSSRPSSPSQRILALLLWSGQIAVTLLFNESAFAQGWEQITPEGLNPVHFFRSFDFQDGTFEVFVWNSVGEATRGYRLNSSIQWDSIPAYYSYWCGPPNEREAYQLVSVGRSSSDPGIAFSIFVRGGCITECFTHVYADTTGEIPTDNQVISFDDFMCAGGSSNVAVSPINQQYVFVSFSDSLYVSSDGGQTFSGRSSPAPQGYNPFTHYLALSPFDTNFIFLAGFDQQRSTYSLYRSNDMGANWSAVLDEEVTQLEFHPTDSTVVYAATSTGIFRSGDRGSSWTNVMPGAFGSIEIRRDFPNIIYAGGTFVGGTGGRLYRSTDRGTSWSLYNDTFTTLSIIGIYQLPSSDTLIVAAADGIFKVHGSFVLAAKESEDIPSQVQLYQNYPNPFNSISNFGFQIRDYGRVELVVYDLLGREVATLVNEELAPGTYARQWDASGMASGVYIYRLKAGGFAETKRMLLLR